MSQLLSPFYRAAARRHPTVPARGHAAATNFASAARYLSFVRRRPILPGGLGPDISSPAARRVIGVAVSVSPRENSLDILHTECDNLTMIGLESFRVGKVYLVATLAAAFALPLPAGACCGGAESCCRAAKTGPSQPASATPAASCCRRHASSEELGPARCEQSPCCRATTDSNDTSACLCSHSADQQRIPPDRSSDLGQPAVLLGPALQTLVDLDGSGTAAPAQFADIPAIPHRILHCTWLI